MPRRSRGRRAPRSTRPTGRRARVGGSSSTTTIWPLRRAGCWLGISTHAGCARLSGTSRTPSRSCAAAHHCAACGARAPRRSRPAAPRDRSRLDAPAARSPCSTARICAGGQVEVLAAVVGQQEAVALACALHGAHAPGRNRFCRQTGHGDSPPASPALRAARLGQLLLGLGGTRPAGKESCATSSQAHRSACLRIGRVMRSAGFGSEPGPRPGRAPVARTIAAGGRSGSHGRLFPASGVAAGRTSFCGMLHLACVVHRRPASPALVAPASTLRGSRRARAATVSPGGGIGRRTSFRY